MRTRRYDGWNLHRFIYNWFCTNCGKKRYESDYAWFYGIANGPYCDHCKEALETEHENERRALTHDP